MRRMPSGAVENEPGVDYWLVGHGTAYERAAPKNLLTLAVWWDWQALWRQAVKERMPHLRRYLPPVSGLMTDRWALFITVMNKTSVPGSDHMFTVDELARTVNYYMNPAA